jgi:hypothetical protein
VLKPAVLIASSVRQKPEILEWFLKSLQELDLDGFDVKYCFIDDNVDLLSSETLHTFNPGQSTVIGVKPEGEYFCTEETHHWSGEQIDRVARQKDQILDYAAENNRHLFLVDSDLVMHPWTLQQLWRLEREVIAEIFWTRWRPEEPFLPQVWVNGPYNLFWSEPGERLEKGEIVYRIQNFLTVLKNPGLYEVGGLGACTLIRRSALEKGVCFRRIPNLDWNGEDRHFCIRATVLGINLYVDTQLPAYHIYRMNDLPGVEVYREKCRQSIELSRSLDRTPQMLEKEKSLAETRRVKTQDNRLTLVMLVRNEADRYLEATLRQTSRFVDAAVIVDDVSTDETPAICRRVFEEAGKPLLLQQNQEPGFHREVELRKLAWELTVATEPDWLLFLDADQVFEAQAATKLRRLLSDPRWDFYSFRLYDFWDENHYREDVYWQAHRHYRPFLIRYQPGYHYEWAEQPLHCGSFPKNITAFPGTISPLRVKHYGWACESDRIQKYQFYLQRDPDGKWGVLEQYRSILDPEPNLIRWNEATE